MAQLPTGSPKLSSSLNQLLGARRGAGQLRADAFASARGLRLDDGRVQVVVETTQAAMKEVRGAVVALGGDTQTHHRSLLQALVPVDALEALARRDDVTLVREPLRPIPASPLTAAAAQSEGLGPSNASTWHAAGYTGAGVRVAVISGGFDGYAPLLGSDLPALVNTYDWTGEGMGGSEHGTACAEIVHDMAPDAAIDLHRVSTDVELGNAVDRAIAVGVDVISFSEGFPLGGPGDGTGYLADIVEDARDHGIFFSVAAGNEAELAWSGPYQDSPTQPGSHKWPHGDNVNCFGPGPAGTCGPIAAGTPILVALHWDDWTTVNQDYDLFLVYWDGAQWALIVDPNAWSLNRQSEGYPTPTELISLEAPFEASYGVAIYKHSATGNACLSLSVPHFDGPLWRLEDPMAALSLSSPADSPDAIAVGAVDVDAPYPLEPYSSRGPTFGPGGACSGGFTKPDVAAYANVSTETTGGKEFSGTSAAAPHVAGAAALVKQAHPTYTVAELQAYLESNAVDLGDPGKDTLHGAGRLRLPAVNLPPDEPSAPSPADGASDVPVDATLTWIGGDPDAGDTVTYDVYLEAGDLTPGTLVCQGVETASCDPGTLQEGLRYFWTVTATDNHGASTWGETWDFSTMGDNQPPYVPENPTPADDADDVSIEATLTWSGGDPDAGDTVSYNVYLETGDTTPDVRVCDGVTATTCDPGTLVERTRYHWVVEAVDESGAFTWGPVWEFTTEGVNQPPHPPGNPSPPDGATDQPLNVDLTWAGGDPDIGDVVTYDVYLEADDPTPDELACEGVTTSSCDPGALLESQQYFWFVMAEDSGGATTTGETWTFSTVAGNTPPTIIGLPDQELEKDSSRDDAIDLWMYAEDQEDEVADLIFTISNSPVPSANVTIDGNRTIDINPLKGWSGTTEVEIQVEDTGGLTDSDTFEVRVPSASFIKHVVSDTVRGAHSVYAADVDGDGNVDILGASARDDSIFWWENDGEEGFTAHLIDNDFDEASAIHASDVDGDGDVDVLGAAKRGGEIAWWESDGEESFTEHVIDGAFRGAYDVYAIDLDGDGDVDVLGAALSADDIAWWENDGEEGFTKHVIDGTFDSAQSVYALDVDGDGDVDVLGAAYHDDAIAWWENDGEEGFTKHVVDDAFEGATSVYATDVDGDGDVDVLGAAEDASEIAWWENDGDEAFTKHPVDGALNVATSVFATDVDGDGAVDVLGTSWYDGVTWWENDGDEAFAKYAIDSSFLSAQSVYATDVDGDMDVDVLAASEFGDEIAWWEQVGGVENRPPNVPVSPTPPDGAVDEPIDVILNWTGGDPDAGDTVTYDVYLGTSSPPPLLTSIGPYSATQTALTVDPGPLAHGTSYVWSVVARDSRGASATGETWTFDTEEANTPPNVPVNPTPPDGAVDEPIDVILSWTGGDPDAGDTVTYDVYLGTSSPPPLLASIGPYSATQTALTVDPGPLAHATSYVWSVVARDSRGASTPGETWAFSTQPEEQFTVFIPLATRAYPPTGTGGRGIGALSPRQGARTLPRR
jgi:subtilisin family serine protease